MKRRWLPLAAFAIAVMLALPRLQALPEPIFSVAPIVAAQTAKISLASTAPIATMLPAYGASAHGVSLAALPDGRIAAAWFAGSREGAADVVIVMSVLAGNAWSTPRPIIDRIEVQHGTGRLIRKLGNPVLWSDPQGMLHLWFVSVSYGGWAGSSINHIASQDGGTSWSPITRLITSPFLNLSTLDRNPPLPLSDGGIGFPVYHEFITKRAEWLRLDDKNHVVDKVRFPSTNKIFQPAVAALDAQHALALLRDAGPTRRIHSSTTNDGGRNWQAATATALPNPDAGIALLRLTNGNLLLAYNPQESNRTQLALSVSRDEGKTWSTPKFVEQGQGEDEFSYPALLQDRSGVIHLAYTWQRKNIKAISFVPSWMETTP